MDEIEVRSPFDGSIVGSVEAAGPGAVDAAVRRSREALATGPLPQWRRAEILDEAARLLRSRSDDFASTIAAEAAKPLQQAKVEAERAVQTFTFAAVEARRLAGEVVPLDAAPVGEGRFGFTLRVPVGVVAAVSPFNFPLNLVAHKVAPAIAAGCPVVLKPASTTPLSAVALRALLVDECGLPPEWLQVVAGPGGTVGDALVTHDDVAMVSFTGSADVGWALRAKVPRKKVALELGNSSPLIVCRDGDWRAAAKAVAAAGYSHAGQSCISVQRVLVDHAVADDFVAALVPAVEALRVGDPMDPATDVSSLISADERDRVVSWIAEAVDGGAEVAVGGTVEGSLLRPAVLTCVTQDMRVVKDEVFGPVVSVQPFSSFDEAVALANGTRYGLQAGIYTSDLGTALDAARRLEFGGVMVNEVPTWRADHMPYGGVGDSGNTREGPAYAVREMTEPRLVVIRP